MVQPNVSCRVCSASEKVNSDGDLAVVMILRVWAMYNRSKLILGSLMTLYSVVMISTVLSVAVNSNTKNLPGM